MLPPPPTPCLLFCLRGRGKENSQVWLKQGQMVWILVDWGLVKGGDLPLAPWFPDLYLPLYPRNKLAWILFQSVGAFFLWACLVLLGEGADFLVLGVGERSSVSFITIPTTEIRSASRVCPAFVLPFK